MASLLSDTSHSMVLSSSARIVPFIILFVTESIVLIATGSVIWSAATRLAEQRSAVDLSITNCQNRCTISMLLSRILNRLGKVDADLSFFLSQGGLGIDAIWRRHLLSHDLAASGDSRVSALMQVTRRFHFVLLR